MHVVGASPEMLIRVEDGVIETHPIAGTRRRGRDAADELRMADELQNSEKERAEHIMLVDLARNDLGRVCQPGTVRGDLAHGDRALLARHAHGLARRRQAARTTSRRYDALRAYFPHGTVTGAPKIRTMEIIAELEGERRGGYGGCVGYFDMSGNCDTALAIRTIWMKAGVAYVQAAGGVVLRQHARGGVHGVWQQGARDAARHRPGRDQRRRNEAREPRLWVVSDATSFFSSSAVSGEGIRGRGPIMTDRRPDCVYGILVREGRVFLLDYSGDLGLPGGVFRPLAEDRKVELRAHLYDLLGIEARAVWAQGAFLYRHPLEEDERFSGFYTVWEWEPEIPPGIGRWLDQDGLTQADIPASLRILLFSVITTLALRTR